MNIIIFSKVNVTFFVVKITFLTVGQFFDHMTKKSKSVPHSKI